MKYTAVGSKDYIKFLNLRFVHFWISSLIGQFKNSEKTFSRIFELTNQRRGRENSKFKNGPTLDQNIVKLGLKFGTFDIRIVIHMVKRVSERLNRKIGDGVTGPRGGGSVICLRSLFLSLFWEKASVKKTQSM